MIMTWETMKVKRYTDKLLASCWRKDRDLVINPTTLGFTPHSIRAEIWSVKERQSYCSIFFQSGWDGMRK